jgi:hypothetical protein
LQRRFAGNHLPIVMNFSGSIETTSKLLPETNQLAGCREDEELAKLF